MVRFAIAISTFLAVCSTAYGEEVLNLELQCDGVICVDSPTLALLSLFGAKTTNEEPFSNRISIKENRLGSKGPRLTVTQTLIYLPEKAEVSEEGLSGNLEIFEIDRLTGALKVKMLVSKPARDAGEAIDATIHINSKCEKLDPNKKLF